MANLERGVQDSCVSKETMYGIAIEGHFAAKGLFPEEILQFKLLHEILQEKISDVQPSGRRGGFLSMRHSLVEIGGKGKTNFSGTVFFIPFPDFFAYISLGVIRDFEKFRMFAEILHIF